jgi:hypothetical protein
MTIGCQAPQRGRPLAKELAGSDPDVQINFWHSLTDERVTSNDEAFHGLLLYADGKDDTPDYAARVAALKSRKWLPKSFDQPADAAVTRGTVAVALVRLMHERGGLTMRLLGPIPRYAVRELMFLNVYPPSTPNQAFSGTEFVGIIGAVEDYQRGRAEAPPAELAAEGSVRPVAATRPTKQPQPARP